MNKNFCPVCSDGILSLQASVNVTKIWDIDGNGNLSKNSRYDDECEDNGCRALICDSCTFEYFNYGVNNVVLYEELTEEKVDGLKSLFNRFGIDCD